MKRFIKVLAAVLIIVSALGVLGTVGAVDCDMITLTQALKQIAISVSIGILGALCSTLSEAVR